MTFDYIKNLIINIFLYKKSRYLIRPAWSKELQTIPPNFGYAKRISLDELNVIINKKKKKIPKDYFQSKINDEIAIVILTCKREKLLKRLIKNLNNFLKNIETFKNYKIYVVDNASNYNENNETCKNYNIKNYLYIEKNIGMSNALRKVYKLINSDYILLIEDDFNIKYQKPFLKNCIDIFKEFNDIGVIRLKNQNNWWKKNRIITDLRQTKSKVKFWTWVPCKNENGWCAGSVIFKKKCLDLAGGIPYSLNINRFQFYVYENYVANKFNKLWNAAKIENCYPFFQPNDNEPIV